MFNRSGFFFGFTCLFLSEGKIFPPPNGTSLAFTPGSTGKIMWSFDDDIKSVGYRSWTFTPSDGRPEVRLTRIIDDGDVQLSATSYEVAVEKPATLVLKNVNLTYNGTYQFSLSPGGSASDVVVYIAVKPNATACSSPIIVSEGDNVSCTCQGQGGNPPADVTWYKDNRKIGETGKEGKTLTLTNVTNGNDHGNYKCVAQSYPNKMFEDDVIVKVIVYEKRPTTTSATKKSTQSTPSKTTVQTTDGVPFGGLSTGAIAGICVAVLLLVAIVIIVVYCCHKKKEKDQRNCGNINPIAHNHYELDNEEPVEGDNSYDTLAPVASGSKSNAPVKDNLPPVYAAVDTNNRQGNTLYASLDTDAMKPKRESRKEPANRAPQTEYASIDFVKTADAPKADPL